MSEQVWDFSPPALEGASWRHAYLSITASSRAEYKRLKEQARIQGSRFSEYTEGIRPSFSFVRSVPGHEATMTISVAEPTMEQEDAIRYDVWEPRSQGGSYA